MPGELSCQGKRKRPENREDIKERCGHRKRPTPPIHWQFRSYSLGSRIDKVVRENTQQRERYSTEIENEYHQCTRHLGNRKTRIDYIRFAVERRVQSEFPDVVVEIIGSTESDLALLSSALDLLVVITNLSDTPDLDLLEKIASLIKVLSFVMDLVIRKDANLVPRIVFVDNITRITVNVMTSQTSNTKSTALLKAYTRCDGRVAPLIFKLKTWASDKGIYSTERDNDTKTLSGHSLSLMAIHFLQQGSRTVVPRFSEVVREIMLKNRLGRMLNFRSMNVTPVSELLQQLLEYFGYKFPFATNVISVTKREPVLKSTILESIDGRHPIYIEEPFDGWNTAANIDTDESVQLIHSTFRRAANELALTGRLDFNLYTKD